MRFFEIRRSLNAYIESTIPSDYHHIWDCCCDHGLLGAALLTRHAAPHIHFVDIEPRLMTKVTAKLERFFPQQHNDASQWQVHCTDVARLKLAHTTDRQLVVIAGVGGDLIAELVTGILKNNTEQSIDFLLCPIYHSFDLRQRLMDLKCSLLEEHLIEENNRSYEILWVTATPNHLKSVRPLHAVGEDIQQANTSDELAVCQRYLNKIRQHYQRRSYGQCLTTHQALAAYQMVEISFME